MVSLQGSMETKLCSNMVTLTPQSFSKKGIPFYPNMLCPKKFKGGIGPGGHLAIIYGGQVIVPPHFFVAKPATKFRSACAALLTWTQNQATIICTDHAEWSRQIWRYNNSPSMMTIKIAATPMALHSGQRPGSLLTFLGYVTSTIYTYLVIYGALCQPGLTIT